MRATDKDVARIVALGAEFHRASAWHGKVDFDARIFARTVRDWIASESVGVFVSPRGFIVVGASPLYFASESIVYEVLFYAPDGRGNDLRKSAEAWAQSRGLKFVLMGTHTTRLKAMGRWFRMAGYVPFGQTFLKAI